MAAEKSRSLPGEARAGVRDKQPLSAVARWFARADRLATRHTDQAGPEQNIPDQISAEQVLPDQICAEQVYGEQSS